MVISWRYKLLEKLVDEDEEFETSRFFWNIDTEVSGSLTICEELTNE